MGGAIGGAVVGLLLVLLIGMAVVMRRRGKSNEATRQDKSGAHGSSFKSSKSTSSGLDLNRIGSKVPGRDAPSNGSSHSLFGNSTQSLFDADDNATLRQVRGESIDIELSGAMPSSASLKGSARPKSDSVEKVLDPDSGKAYYFNKFTGDTGWSPEEVSRVPALKGVGRGGAGAGGTEAGSSGGMLPKTQSVISTVDPSTGKSYFYNQFTQKSGWDEKEVSRAATSNEYGINHVEVEEQVVMANPMFARPQRRQVDEAGGKGLTATHKSRQRMA
jgi:hypothetical protein